MDRFAVAQPAGLRLLAAALLLLVLAIAGCGGDDKQPARKAAVAASRAAKLTPVGDGRFDYARGIFNELCAGCHTLADAGATGHRFDLDRVPDLEAGLVWNAIQHGEPGMPAWKHVISDREISALAVYIINVAGHRDGEDRWGTQIHRRIEGENARWSKLADLIERELDREGRKGEQPSGQVVPPKAE